MVFYLIGNNLFIQFSEDTTNRAGVFKISFEYYFQAIINQGSNIIKVVDEF